MEQAARSYDQLTGIQTIQGDTRCIVAVDHWMIIPVDTSLPSFINGSHTALATQIY